MILGALIFAVNLRNALPSNVRNKDRMAVEPILCLTRPTVLDVLEELTFVVHIVVPESVASGNQIKVYRPLYAKDQSPLNVERKAKFLLWATI